MSPTRFFYLLPKVVRARREGEGRLSYLLSRLRAGRRQAPMGGVKVIYLHCDVLSRNGFTAHPVHVGGDFIVDWFPHQCQALSEAEALRMVTEDDIVVCPEVVPQLAARFRTRRKVAFVQGWSLVDLGTGGRRYEDMGFTSLLACSEYNRQFMAERSSLSCPLVRNGIDHGVFCPPEAAAPSGHVLYLARKHANEARDAVSMLPEPLRRQTEIVEHVGPSTEKEMAAYYQRCDVFLATGYPEGFGLPPLEAMACGCAVVGFTGGGGNEFMLHEQTALVAPDGDVPALAQQLERVLTDTELKERLRTAGLAKAREYTSDRMAEDVVTFAQSLTAETSQ